MRRAFLLALAALPLLGFDCGGPDPTPTYPGSPIHCSLAIRGAVSEDLWCIVSVYDYSRLDPMNTMYVFELVAYRSMYEVGAEASFWLDGRAVVGTPYGWDSTGTVPVTNVDSGSAIRYDAAMTDTHFAMAPFGDAGTGKLTATFTGLPPVGAPDSAMTNVYGTLTATVPSSTAGAAVTFTASF